MTASIIKASNPVTCGLKEPESRRAKSDATHSLRAVVEEGLRPVLSTQVAPSYELADLRVGDPQEPDPLERYSWPELRELIYGGDGP